MRNNVVYNVRHGFVHHNPSTGQFNIVGNYYKQGMNDSLIPFYFDDLLSPTNRCYLAGNFIDDPGDGCNRIVDDPWTDDCHPSFANMEAPVSMRSATSSASSGASPPSP